MKKIITAFAAVFVLAFSSEGALISHLTFNDSNDPLHATVGADAFVRSNAVTDMTGLGGCSLVNDSSVLAGADGGVLNIVSRRYLVISNGITSASTTAERRNWCMQLRFYMPYEGSGTYWCFFSLNPANNDDGYLFYKKNSGFGGGKGSFSYTIPPGDWSPYDTWHTMVLSASESVNRLYIDGAEISSVSNDRLTLPDDIFYLAADNDGEDSALYVDDFKFWNESEPLEIFGYPIVSFAVSERSADRLGFSGTLMKSGTETDSVDVYFAYALHGESLGEYALVTNGWEVGTEFFHTLTNLVPLTKYDYRFKVVNSEDCETVTPLATVKTMGETGSWEYDPTVSKITDGQWSLNVQELPGRKLKILSINGATPTGLTRLDLGTDPLDDAGNDYSVTAIDSSVFSAKSGASSRERVLALAEVVLPPEIESIGSEAFFYAPIEHVEPFLPNTLTFIGASAFETCAITNALVFEPVSPVAIYKDVFFNASTSYEPRNRIPSVLFGANVVNIPEKMFNANDSLTNVTFLGAVTNIGRTVFSECLNLRKVTPFLPPSLRMLGLADNQVFYSCPLLEGPLYLGWTDEGPLDVGWQNAHGMFELNITIGDVYIGPAITNNLHRSAFWNVYSISNVYLAAYMPDCTGPDNKNVDTRNGVFHNIHTSNGDYKTRFHICKSVLPQWREGFLDNPAYFTPWAELDSEEKAKYTTAFPNDKHPMGLGLAPLFGWKQWVMSFKSEFCPVTGFMINVR